MFSKNCKHLSRSSSSVLAKQPAAADGVPAVPRVHAKIVKQQSAEVERSFGFLVGGFPLAGGTKAYIGVPPPHLLLLLLGLTQDGSQDGALLLQVHAVGRGGRLVQPELRLREALRAALAQILQQLIQEVGLLLLHLLHLLAAVGQRV